MWIRWRRVASSVSTQWSMAACRSRTTGVRLTARLVAVDGGTSLWANSFTERVGGLLAVQDSLAMQLASAITTELSDETRSGMLAQETTDVEAWQLYANGRYQLERRDAASLRRAIEFFEAALRRDPRFAPASAGFPTPTR